MINYQSQENTKANDTNSKMVKNNHTIINQLKSV